MLGGEPQEITAWSPNHTLLDLRIANLLIASCDGKNYAVLPLLVTEVLERIEAEPNLSLSVTSQLYVPMLPVITKAMTTTHVQVFYM